MGWVWDGVEVSGPPVHGVSGWGTSGVGVSSPGTGGSEVEVTTPGWGDRDRMGWVRGGMYGSRVEPVQELELVQ